MLYVPPRIAHWGVAVDECTTWSFGFRAPRASDMVSVWIDRLLEQADSDDFFHDALREPALRPGEISAPDMERAVVQLQAALAHYKDQRWFGELVTEPRFYPPVLDEDAAAEVREALRCGDCTVMLDEGSRVAWQLADNAVTVFANGHSRNFPQSALPDIEQLCGSMALRLPMTGADSDQGASDDSTLAVLYYLLERGCIYVGD